VRPSFGGLYYLVGNYSLVEELDGLTNWVIRLLLLRERFLNSGGQLGLFSGESVVVVSDLTRG
jgi:hypothetical protein